MGKPDITRVGVDYGMDDHLWYVKCYKACMKRRKANKLARKQRKKG